MKGFLKKHSQWWRGLSVSHKLYTVVGVMALLIAIELFTLLFAMNTLSAVRALVGGEGIWSKAQKDAVLDLQRYAYSRDNVHYKSFKKHIEIPLGDHQARVEMEKPDMDYEVVRDGFLKGQLAPDDIEPVVRLLRRFHKISYIQHAFAYWTRGDAMMARLIEAADELHQAINHKQGIEQEEKIHTLLAEISEINDKLTEIENAFSFTLGQASRWLENILMILLVIAVITVESTGLLLTIAFSRRLSRSLTELKNFSTEVGSGDFSKTLSVNSTDELGQLAMSLNKMALDLKEVTVEREVADRASQVKSLFLANMSHEIRTPLNSILGFVELLREESLSKAERKKYLDIIERTGNSVATIINDILDISKVEAGKFEIEKASCSLEQIITDVKSLLSLRSESKGIFLEFKRNNLPENIITDPTRLKQILLNVIGNAIKYTDKGGVTVSFEIKGNQLHCLVNDTGGGIQKENRDKLFQPFSQIDPSIRKRFSGAGLGLILSKRLAQFLGGDVVLLKSTIGVGSTFLITVTFEFPIQRVGQRQAMPAGQQNNFSFVGKKILVVEDSLDNQLLAQQFLGIAGAQIAVANNGQEAIDTVSKTDYDLILMDMQMPVVDGYTATSHLRKMGCTMPIIALTAHAMKEDLEKCINVGCNGYLSKPYRRDGLLTLVSLYLRNNSSNSNNGSTSS